MPVGKPPFLIKFMTQAILIAKLRWTLFKNSLRRRASLFEFVMGVVAFLVFSIFDIGISIGLGVMTYAAYGHPFFTPLVTVTLAAIFVVWQLLPLLTASFSSDLNISKFKIYPVATGSLFLIDLMLAVFDPVSVLATVLVGGVFAGVIAASPETAPLAVVAALIFLAFNVGLARYLQRLFSGLFASRRRKELLALFIFLLLFVPQVLVMIGQRPSRRTAIRDRSRQSQELKERLREMEAIGRAIRWTPPGLAAATLNKENSSYDRLLMALLASLLFVAAPLWLEYHRLTREHLGREPRSKRAAKPGPIRGALVRSHRAARISPSERYLSESDSRAGSVFGLFERLLSPVSAAVFEKDVKYMYRSPRALLIAIAPIAGAVIFVLPGSPLSISSVGEYRLAAILLYALVVSSQLLNNCFAFDWHGAKLYFTSPSRGTYILAGKNLAAASSIACQVAVIGSAFCLLSGTVNLAAIINALFVLCIAFPIELTIGNYLSVLYPRGIDFSKIYGKSYSGVSAIVSLAVLPGLVVVVGTGPLLGWLFDSRIVVYAVLTGETVISVAAYLTLIRRAGALLETRAEQFLQGLLTAR